MRSQQGGFTLIELVIVMVILGILAAVAVPQFYSAATTDAQAAASNAGKSAAGSALAIAIATKKGPPSCAEVATQLPGSTATGTGLSIDGKVNVVLSPNCTSVTGVGAATYST